MTRIRSIVIVPAILASLAGVGVAQPGLSPPGSVEPTRMSLERLPGDQLSESTALALSLGGTAASYAAVVIGAEMNNDNGYAIATVGAIGTIFAPSLGHWYAGARMTRGLAVRLLGLGTALTGAVITMAECPLFSDEDCQPTVGPGLAIVGAGAYVFGTVDDIITAPGRVRRHNAALDSVVVVPTVIRGGGGGVTVAGRF